MADLREWGASPDSGSQNPQYEKTYALLYDTLLYTGGTTPAAQTLFDSSVAKASELRNATFTGIQASAKYTITGIRATVGMAFAARNTSEPVATQQMYFENYSNLNLVINNKTYNPIVLENLLPQSYQYQGGTATPVNKTDFDVFWLPDPFVIPKFNAISLTFAPPANILLAAAANTNPVVAPTSTTTSFYVRIELWGTLERGLA
jgi:hypothetical protein